MEIFNINFEDGVKTTDIEVIQTLRILKNNKYVDAVWCYIEDQGYILLSKNPNKTWEIEPTLKGVTVEESHQPLHPEFKKLYEKHLGR